MAFLLDTNVVSELRKTRGNNAEVYRWISSVPDEELFTSVIVIGEIRRGIEKIRSVDPAFASKLEVWLRTLRSTYEDRILSVTEEIAELWGTICPDRPLPEPDGLIAATALHHGMTLVTRNAQRVRRSGVKLLNPWKAT
jgi:toxin FitB